VSNIFNKIPLARFFKRISNLNSFAHAGNYGLLKFQAPAADGAVEGCVLLQASVSKHRQGVLVLVDHAGWGRCRRARMVRPGRVSRKREFGFRLSRSRGRSTAAGTWPGRVRRRREVGAPTPEARGQGAVAVVASCNAVVRAQARVLAMKYELVVEDYLPVEFLQAKTRMEDTSRMLARDSRLWTSWRRRGRRRLSSV